MKAVRCGGWDGTSLGKERILPRWCLVLFFGRYWSDPWRGLSNLRWDIFVLKDMRLSLRFPDCVAWTKNRGVSSKYIEAIWLSLCICHLYMAYTKQSCLKVQLTIKTLLSSHWYATFILYPQLQMEIESWLINFPMKIPIILLRHTLVLYFLYIPWTRRN